MRTEHPGESNIHSKNPPGAQSYVVRNPTWETIVRFDLLSQWTISLATTSRKIIQLREAVSVKKHLDFMPARAEDAQKTNKGEWEGIKEFLQWSEKSKVLFPPMIEHVPVQEGAPSKRRRHRWVQSKRDFNGTGTTVGSDRERGVRERVKGWTKM